MSTATRRAGVTGYRAGPWYAGWAVVLGVAVLLGVAALAGCTAGGADPTATPESPTNKLAAIKAYVDRASSVRMAMTSRDIPGDAQGVLGAKGVGAHPPAFKGTVTARVKGIQADIDIIAVDGKIYAKLPLVPGMREVSADQLDAPDPAMLFNPDKGITPLLTMTTDAAYGPETRSGSDVLATITGKLPGAKIVDLFWTGDRSGEFAVTYGYVEATGELRTVELTGPFFGAATSTYALTLDQYGQQVDIRAP